MLLGLLNAAGMMLATFAGAFGGAWGLMFVAKSVGIPPNPGIAMIGFGIGGLAGFFLWAIPQMPKRKKPVT